MCVVTRMLDEMTIVVLRRTAVDWKVAVTTKANKKSRMKERWRDENKE